MSSNTARKKREHYAAKKRQAMREDTVELCPGKMTACAIEGSKDNFEVNHFPFIDISAIERLLKKEVFGYQLGTGVL